MSRRRANDFLDHLYQYYGISHLDDWLAYIWLADNSPIYFDMDWEYLTVVPNTPEESLHNIWLELGYTEEDILRVKEINRRSE